MDEEELARLQEQIDEYERATGERSPLRAVLEAQTKMPEPQPQPEKAPQESLESLLTELPQSPVEMPPAELQAPPVERPLEPAITEYAQPQAEAPPEPLPVEESVGTAPLTAPARALEALLPAYEATKPVRKFFEPVTELAHQATAGTVATLAGAPWNIAAQLAAVPTMLNSLLGDEKAEQMKGTVKWLSDQGVGADEAMRELLKLEASKTAPGAFGAEMGKVPMFGPWGVAATVGGTAAAAGVKKTLDWFYAEPANTMHLGPPPEPSPFRFVSTAYAKPGEPELPVPRDNETGEQFAKRMDEYDAAVARWQAGGLPQAAKVPEPPKTMPSGLTPTAERIIQTVGGPQKISEPDYTGMGILGAATLGMVLFPPVFGALKFNKTPRLRQVRDAAPGTVAISTPTDLFRSMDNITAGVINISRRAGVTPAEVDAIDQGFRIQTRSGARAEADSVIQTGKMETPSYRFAAPESLESLQRRATPQTDQYLRLRDAWDQANIEDQAWQRKPTSTRPPAPETVHGMTLSDIGAAMHALEKSNPEVVPYAKQYYAHVKEVRNFQANGEYATIPTKRTHKDPAVEDRSLEWLNSQRKNEVPFRGERNIGIDIAEREGPISDQAYHTRKALKERMENEVTGITVDTIRRRNPNLFVEVTAEELSRNPHWRKNTVSFYRRGALKHYTTDPFLADVMKFDKYQLTGMWGAALYNTKRLLEFGATGLGAPAFSFISLLRSWQISKYTAEAGFKSASLRGSLYAIPKQVLPQMAKFFSRAIDEGGGKWLKQVFPEAHVDALSRRLAYEFDRSLYAQLKQVGTSKGSVIDQVERSTKAIATVERAMQNAPAPIKLFWNSWKAFFESVHNGPAFDFVTRNLHVESLPKLASRARRLTGDPRTEGQYYVRAGRGEAIAEGTWRPIRFETDRVISRGAVKLARAYGVPMQLMSESVPWFNATLQGAKRIGEAYLDNPVKFTARMWMYAMAPAASEYLYAFMLGNDPNGVSYVDHMLNRRSAYNRQMNWYIPIPGRPANEGVEIPFFHEMAPFKRMMEIGMDHMLRTNRHGMERTLGQDYWNAMWGFLDTAVIPPMPPIMAASLSMAGFQPPQGVFGGEAYKRKDDPFDQTGGMPNSIEAMSRVLGAGIGQTLGQMYAAYAQTPEGFTTALNNAAKAGLRVQVQRTPFLRDIVGMQPTLVGNTEVTKELFEKQKEIDRLSKFIGKWSVGGKTAGPGEISVEPASKGGGLVADYLLGKGFTTASPGLAQPPPTNPLYTHFMDQVQARFRKESPTPNRSGEDEGGIAYKSLWRRYGDATEKLQRLKNVNEGNYVTWQKQLDKEPEARAELDENGIDSTNIRKVRNFYEAKRHDAARVILYMVRAVEHDMTKQLSSNPGLARQLGWDGKPITLEKLDPYKRTGVVGGMQKWAEDWINPPEFSAQ